MSKLSKKTKQWKVRLEQLPPHIKRLIIVGAVLLGIIVVSLILLFIASQQKFNEESALTGSQEDQLDANARQSRRDAAVRDGAEKAIEAGDTSKASEIYKTAVQSETDTAKKVQLYIDQSGILYAANKYQDAINVAKQAEGVSDDKFLVADWLSRLYEDQKQYKLAAEYYTLAGKWATSPTNKTRLTKSYYDTQASRVAALVEKQ